MKSEKEEKIARKLERHEKKDRKVRLEREQEDVYEDLPSNVFHKLYK